MKQTNKRKAGILLPVSALPSPFGIGTLGQEAYDFIDWLEKSGMKIWQVLPLLPTGYGDSPYQSCASDALNYYFIDFRLLEQEGLLKKEEYESIVWGEDERRVDYGKQFACKIDVLRKAFARINENDEEWDAFIKADKYLDFAIFMALKRKFNYAPWKEWAEPYANYNRQAVEKFAKENIQEIRFWQFTQFIFLKQWQALKAYANKKRIEIMGDMPIYVSEDSVECWKYRKELFMLDEKGAPAFVAGVPPDDFSKDGQLWGNPVYDWKKHKQDGYAWWKKRIRYAFTLFDIVRIDHFRGFDRFFAIPIGAETAIDGEWLGGPGAKLFADLKDAKIVAEDLGIIDDGVRKMMKETGYPGMKVLLFSFDGDPECEHKPSNYTENIVAYTGTHDNDTFRGYVEKLTKEERQAFEEELEAECLTLDTPYITESIEEECQSAVALLFASKANTVIVPLQDVLAFGNEARMNAPSTLSQGNWSFRFVSEDFKRRKASWLKELTQLYER